MSREIKFRQWDERSKEFFYWGFNVGDFIFASPAISTSSKPIGDSEQFTGLQDKNGKDIYDGDIIQCYHAFLKFSERTKEENGDSHEFYTSPQYKNEMKDGRRVCVWSNYAGFEFSGIDKKAIGVLRMSKGKSLCEIIGNIHQNEDFLK